MGFKLNKLCEKANVKGMGKQVLSKLCDHASPSNNYQCWPSNKTLASETGRSVRSIQRAIKSLKDRFSKFGPCFEDHLLKNSFGFCAGKQMTFADVLLAEALSSYLEWIPNILKDKPQISALYEKVLNVKEINI